MELEDNLKKIFNDRGLNANSVAQATEIPRSNIERWLTGANPDVKQLLTLAKFLGVTVDYLVTGKSSSPTIEDLVEKFEVHTGLYEVSVKKVNKK
jgi:transcriptional regulator with XRE-family HTH domain